MSHLRHARPVSPVWLKTGHYGLFVAHRRSCASMPGDEAPDALFQDEVLDALIQVEALEHLGHATGSYLIIEKMIDGTNGSPDGWIASMHIAASGLFADISTSSVSPASMGTMPCEMMTSLARLPSSWQS